MVTRAKRVTARPAKKRSVKRAVPSNGAPATEGVRRVEIPPLAIKTLALTLVGNRPLMVNSKAAVAPRLAEIYKPGENKASRPKVEMPVRTKDEQYADAFYVMPYSKYPAPHPKGAYGIPVSGIQKCVKSAVRPSGEEDNTKVGQAKLAITAIFAPGGGLGGLAPIRFSRFERDIRIVNVSQRKDKFIPDIRHRPMFFDWECDVLVNFNALKLSEESVFNLFLYAGEVIGWGELRAERGYGECGGFSVRVTK